MAKQVQDILVTLGIQGYEELAKLKNAFRGLSTTVDQSDSSLQAAREAILNYGSQAQRSTALLKGLESALKGVQEQVTIGSPLYKELARDIDGVSNELAQLSVKYETVADRATKAATAQQNAANAAARNQYLNRPTEAYVPSGATGIVAPTALDEAIAALREVNSRSNATIASLEEQKNAWVRVRNVLDPASADFATVTKNVTTLQQRLEALAITQKKTASTTPEVDATPYERAKKALDEVLGKSDSTIASLREQLNAWNALRDVLDPSTDDFAKATIRIVSLTESLNRLKIAQDKVGKSNTAAVYTPYEEALKRLRDVKRVSDTSIQSLDAQRNAWIALRRAVDPSSAAFGNATKQIKELSAQLDQLAIKQEKVDAANGRRPFDARRLAATAGAALSGGVFGGPEGFIGGVAGGVLGGEGGAFAGAALGAQLAGLRQAASSAAEYAAAINQQRRALEGVIDDSSAYQQSLAFIDSTSRQLAIPQEQVTRNFTRLSAAVIGAGGNVDVAQEAFNGIAAGIRGTGGSLADLDAALLATAQVFSKGKVSAEELRGQIGERLPGAFTLFAQSIGKTPQELDKLLERGEVGLNDFVTFVRKLNTEYGQQALQLAASTEAAGDRLTTALGRIQEAIGKAFQPVGAEFQETLARFVQENEAGLVALAQSLANAAKGFLDFAVSVGPALVELGKYALAFGAVTLAIKAFTTAVPLVLAALRLMGAQFIATSQQVALAETRLITFGTTVKALAASLAVPIVLTIIVQGIAEAISNLERVKRLKQEVADLPSVEEFISSRYRNSVVGPQDRQQLIRDLEETNEAVAKQQVVAGKAQAKLQELSAEARKFFSLKKPKPDELLVARAEADKELAALNNLIERRKELGRLMGTVGTGSPQTSGAGFSFPQQTPTATTAKEKKGPKPPENRTLELQQELVYLEKINAQEVFIEELRRKGQELNVLRAEYSRQELEIQYEQQKALANANYQSERIVINKIAEQKLARAALDLKLKIDALDKERFDRDVANSQAVKDAAKPIREAQAARQQELDNAKEFGRLVREGILPDEAERLINYNNLVKSLIKQQEEELKLLQTKLLLLETSGLSAEIAEGERKKIQEQIDLIKKKKAAITGAAVQGPGPAATDADRIQSAIDNIQGELNELTNIANIVINSATLIGDAFAGAFEQLVTGAGSAREVLSNFFKEVAQGFLKMATQIIAKQITMLILQTALKALGAAVGDSSGPTSFGADNPVGDFAFGAAGPIPADTAFPGFAKGGAFNRQGYVERYARGGVISRPTVFQFAKGGSFAPGLMGEAGPEAILPLQRTPNGRLGVTMAMPRQGAPALRESMDRSRAGGGSATVMNMSFQTTRFMDREWVDREQLEAAMAKAAKDGGAQGERRALAKLQNSPRTRTRLALR